MWISGAIVPFWWMWKSELATKVQVIQALGTFINPLAHIYEKEIIRDDFKTKQIVDKTK